jgi:uncharacterized protein (DUF2267 family)
MGATPASCHTPKSQKDEKEEETMKHDAFIGQVQHHARLDSRGAAERATRATLETLAERLAGGEANDLAAQLPLPGYTSILPSFKRFRLGALRMKKEELSSP